MTCDQMIALAEIGMLAKALAAICWATAGGIVLALVVTRL